MEYCPALSDRRFSQPRRAGQDAFATDIGLGAQQSPCMQKEPNRTRCRWADTECGGLLGRHRCGYVDSMHMISQARPRVNHGDQRARCPKLVDRTVTESHEGGRITLSAQIVVDLIPVSLLEAMLPEMCRVSGNSDGR